MAERRMYAKTIVLSDSFLDMPMSARCLYFTLGMVADDDGFVNNPKSIMRQCGASQDDLLNLIGKRFILAFDSGIIVIKHWRLNNYLRSDRYSETKYLEEKSTLIIEPNGTYTEAGIPDGIPVVYPDKDSIGKDSIVKDSIESKPTHKYGEYKNVLLTDEELEKFKSECPVWKAYIEDLSAYIASTGKKYKSHLATLRNWYRKDQDKAKQEPQKEKQSNASYDLNAWTQTSINKPLTYKK